MKLDFSTLEADVALWVEGFIEQVRENGGEEAVEETRKDFEANPWLPLLWFVEDRVGPSPCPIIHEGPLSPKFHEVEMVGAEQASPQ